MKYYLAVLHVKAAKEGMLKEQLTPLHVAFCLILADTSRYKEEVQNGLRQVIIKYKLFIVNLILDVYFSLTSVVR